MHVADGCAPERPRTKVWFDLLNLGLNWLKNTVLAELLGEKNTVLTKKKAEQTEYRVSRTEPLTPR